MANTSRTGFWPVGTLSGSPWQAAVKVFDTDSSASNIFVGDLVKIEADGYVAPATAGSTDVIGVCVGRAVVSKPDFTCSSMSLAGTTEVARSRKHATAGESVLVCVAPDQILEGQATGSTLDRANIGASMDIVAGSGSTTTGISGHYANFAGAGTSAAQLKLYDLSTKIGNDNSAANNKGLFVINEHYFKKTAGV